MSTSSYIGRFAPSPTGPLHIGSLIAATGSFLEAKTRCGKWLLRIDDIDTPRVVPNAAKQILRTLERFGFEWDDKVIYQHDRLDAYRATFDRLDAQALLYPCGCSRKELADSALARDGARRYPGTCRNGLPPGKAARAWRIRAEGTIHFADAVQGPQSENLARDVGDYVLLRADGVHAYHLGTVVDDALDGVTHIVRGADLLDSTGRQIYLRQQLELPLPAYAHLPVAVNRTGEKLSKQTLAAPVDDQEPARALLAALRFLGQNPDKALANASLAEVWTWAKTHWQLTAVPSRRSIVLHE